MFTINQIKEAHAKVGSGADFPGYVQELKTLGILFYNNYVSDGHTEYYGSNDFTVSSPPKYPVMEISNAGANKKLEHALAIHQGGQTDYLTFCGQAAEAGVEKWTVNMLQMTCTYYGKSGNEMLVEEIPLF